MYNVREVNEEQLFLWLSSSALFRAAEAAGSSFSEVTQCIVPDIGVIEPGVRGYSRDCLLHY